MKRFWMLLIVVLCLAMLSACRGQKENVSDAPKTAATQPTEAGAAESVDATDVPDAVETETVLAEQEETGEYDLELTPPSESNPEVTETREEELDDWEELEDAFPNLLGGY